MYLESVWEGRDSELLDAMIQFYSSGKLRPSNCRILDATYNAGRIWRESLFKRCLTTMDIDPTLGPDIICDNRIMPGVADGLFDVVVYDPPHVGPQAGKARDFDSKFGAFVPCGAAENWCLSYLYPGFITQAKRVLKPGGLLLAKITDMVNNHRSKWSHLDFMLFATEGGLTVCDLIVKVRKGPMNSTKWQRMRHARKRHCFWIVCRNSDSCE